MRKELPNSLKKLIASIEGEQFITNTMLKDFVIKAKVLEEDLLDYADFAHERSDSYGRKLVYDGGRFKILVNTWNPGDFSGIHSHGYVDWGLIKYYGEGQQNVYHLQNDQITLSDIQTMTNGSYEEITNSMIHQTGNNSNKPFITLHIYGSNQRDKNISEGTEIFNFESMEIQVTNGEAMLMLPQSKIVNTAPAPLTDKATYMYNSLLLVKFYRRLGEKKYGKRIDAIIERMLDYYI